MTKIPLTQLRNWNFDVVTFRNLQGTGDIVTDTSIYLLATTQLPFFFICAGDNADLSPIVTSTH